MFAVCGSHPPNRGTGERGSTAEIASVFFQTSEVEKRGSQHRLLDGGDGQ